MSASQGMITGTVPRNWSMIWRKKRNLGQPCILKFNVNFKDAFQIKKKFSKIKKK
jgi:hypothetical protein